MKYIIRILTILSISIGLADASPTEEALRFVEAMKLGNNIKVLSFRAAQRTNTFAIMQNNIGYEKAKAALTNELNKSISKHQAQWNQNLALAYLEYFTPEELNSISQEKQSSPHAKKFITSQSKVGASMQKTSKGLLEKIITEAVKNAYTNTLQ